MERLGQPSVALYQQHWPGFPIVNSWANDRFYQGLAECQKQGLAQAVGVSNHNEGRLKRAFQVMQVSQQMRVVALPYCLQGIWA